MGRQPPHKVPVYACVSVCGGAKVKHAMALVGLAWLGTVRFGLDSLDSLVGLDSLAGLAPYHRQDGVADGK